MANKKLKCFIQTDLNTLLSTYKIASHNVQRFHFFVKDSNFFEIHEHTEKLYEEYNDKVDEIAELLLSVGLTSANITITDSLKDSLIKEDSTLSAENNGSEIVEKIIQYTETFIAAQSELLMKIEQEKKRMLEIYNDSITYGKLSIISDTLIGYIKEQSKFLWMLSSTRR